MTKQVFKILFLFLSALIFDRCAQVGQLTGGARDTVPPKILEAIPANQNVNFNSSVIILRFDEFVQLSDLTNQLIVSPKLATTPEIEADGKKIKITVKKEELLPNTTYRFYFGQSIVDMHEGNPIQNFEYIFSTGQFIDSLKVTGKVLEAFNNKASGNVLVALYNNKETSDSLPYLKTPDYLSRTNEIGNFVFNNLPYASFKAYAFTDKNKNYLYDGETEKIAFIDSSLNLKSDSTLHFRLFNEEPAKVFVKKTLSPYFGLVHIILSKKTLSTVRPLAPNGLSDIYETNANTLKDTISIYYRNTRDTLGLIIDNQLQKKNDTLIIPLPKKGVNKKKFKNSALSLNGNVLSFNSKAKIHFLNWMDTSRTDLSKIKLTNQKDSSRTPIPVSGRWLNATVFELNNFFKEGSDYNLRIDTNAFFDITSVPNDSLYFSFKTQSKTDFGKLTLKLLLSKKQNYIIQLINDKEEVIKEQFASLSLSSSNSVTIDMSDITPGTYLAKIIYDDNKNKKWDSGNLILKQQPERVIIHPKQMKILSDWEIEEEISIRE